MSRWLAIVALAACGAGKARAPVVADDSLANRFPLARLDDRALCDQLLARQPADYAVTVDPEPSSGARSSSATSTSGRGPRIRSTPGSKTSSRRRHGPRSSRGRPRPVRRI